MSTVNSRINTPLRNYFFYKSGIKITKPLTDGFINFYKNDDHSEAGRLNVYQDPDLTIPYSNPLELDGDGGCAPIYLQAEPYYIEVWSSEDQLQFTLENYEGALFSSDAPAPAGSAADNIFTNGQFTYPLDFSETTDTPGLIVGGSQEVAFAWQFNQDSNTTTKNIITFQNVSAEEIEADPLYQLVLDSSSVMATESVKDLTQIISRNIAKYQNQPITFSFEMINLLTGTVGVELLMLRFYGRGGSETETIPLTTFTVTVARQKLIYTYTMPSVAGKIIGADAYIAIILRMGVKQNIKIGLTNCLALAGDFTNPVYPQEPTNVVQAKIIGSQIILENDSETRPFIGHFDTWNPVRYVEGGFEYRTLDSGSITGDMMIETIGKEHPWQRLCDGSAIQVSQYYNYTPNRRLYDVIGNTYGSGGDLVVTSQNNMVIFDSVAGGRQKSAYTAGNMGSKVTVVNTVVGLKLGITASLNSANSVLYTFADKFAVNQSTPDLRPDPSGVPGAFQIANNSLGNYYAWNIDNDYNPNTRGSGAISITTTDPGSPADYSTGIITFNSTNMADYRTGVGNGNYIPTGQTFRYDVAYTVNFIEFASQSTSARGYYVSTWLENTTDYQRNSPVYSPMAIVFSVDGTWNNGLQNGGTSGNEELLIVPFATSQTLSQNIQTFIKSINNPFEWRITINTVPAASDYFFYSSTDTDYYNWYQVDGIGTDPAIAGRTGVMTAITSGDSLTVIAQKTAAALDSLTYSLPDQTTDLPEIPAGGATKLAWYISI